MIFMSPNFVGSALLQCNHQMHTTRVKNARDSIEQRKLIILSSHFRWKLKLLSRHTKNSQELFHLLLLHLKSHIQCLSIPFSLIEKYFLIIINQNTVWFKIPRHDHITFTKKAKNHSEKASGKKIPFNCKSKMHLPKSQFCHHKNY